MNLYIYTTKEQSPRTTNYVVAKSMSEVERLTNNLVSCEVVQRNIKILE